MPPGPPEIDSFRTRMASSSEQHSSRIVLALNMEGDSPKHLFERSRRLLKRTTPNLCGLKLGPQTVLNLGSKLTQRILQITRDKGVPSIIDDKLNDIDETNRQIASAYFNIGFDAIIVNPFVGWRGGLEPVFQLARNLKRGIITLVYMSHLGADESYGQRVLSRGKSRLRPQYMLFAERAVKWGADGVVVGATRPRIIGEVSSVLQGKLPIYSPGVGTQGGSVTKAAIAGTDYFIIGRSITNAPNPGKAAARFARESLRKQT